MEGGVVQTPLNDHSNQQDYCWTANDVKLDEYCHGGT